MGEGPNSTPLNRKESFKQWMNYWKGTVGGWSM